MTTKLKMSLGRRALPFRTIALLAMGLSLAQPVSAASPTFVVRYRSATNVYLDGGRGQGLSLGDRLAIVVGTEPVAELEVVFLADESASCRLVSEKRSVRAGDTASLLPRPETPASPAAETPTLNVASPAVASSEPTASLRTGRPRPWARPSGFVSAGLYRVWDTGAGFDFTQKLGRLDFSLAEIGGQPLTFNTRFRSRRDERSLSLGSTRVARRNDLYQMSLRYEPPSDNVSFEVGRLGSSALSTVGYLDGGLVRVRLGSPVQIGGFFGRQADVYDLGSEATGQKYGAFFRVSPRNPYSASYDVIVAVVREFSRSDVSREFVGVESRFGSGAVSVFERAEVDINRGWRRELSDHDYQLSNVSVAANLRFSPSATAVLSYDSLRNYRDYLTRAVPEQIFDDLLHQGYRASLYLGKGYGLNATAGFGLRLADRNSVTSRLASNAYSYNAGLRHGNLFGKDMSLGFDVNAFQNTATTGYLATVQAGKRLRQGHQFDLSYGRSLYRVVETGLDRRTEYLRFTGRGDLGRHVYLLADVEYDRGDDLQGPRGFFEIGYRF